MVVVVLDDVCLLQQWIVMIHGDTPIIFGSCLLVSPLFSW